MTLTNKTICAWLGLLLLALTLAVWTIMGMMPEFLAMFWLASGAAFCLTFAIRYSFKLAKLQRCRNDSEFRDSLLRDMHADDLPSRRSSLETLADYFGQPFGAVEYMFCDRYQVEGLTALYKAWWRAWQQVGPQLSIRDVLIQVKPRIPEAELWVPSNWLFPQPINPDAEEPSQSVLFQKLTEAIREPTGNPFMRAADAVKEAILDWEGGEAAQAADAEVAELPAMRAEEFVNALRPVVEKKLCQLAETLNQAPAGRIIDAAQARACELLAQLWCEALEKAVQMRVEAANAALPPGQRPKGGWAEKLRRMQAAGVAFPSFPDSEKP